MKGAIAIVVGCVLILVALDQFDVRARALVADVQDAKMQTALPPPPAKSSSATPPVLSETDRLKVINASQSVEIWTLRVQQAAGELQKARSDFDRVVGSVTPSGWQLNDKLEFVKVDK